jgi:hypothetical protein
MIETENIPLTKIILKSKLNDALQISHPLLQKIIADCTVQWKKKHFPFHPSLFCQPHTFYRRRLPRRSRGSLPNESYCQWITGRIRRRTAAVAKIYAARSVVRRKNLMDQQPQVIAPSLFPLLCSVRRIRIGALRFPLSPLGWNCPRSILCWIGILGLFGDLV